MLTRLKPLLFVLFSVGCGLALLTWVDLTPKIDENFFFASDDPQFQNSRKLDEMFGLPPQLVLTAEGDIRARAYLDDIASLSLELRRLDGVTGVYSLASGPSSVEGAIKSPLWSRLLIAREERGSNFVLILEKREDYGPLVERIGALQRRYESDGFRLSVTGVPYVVHEIQKQLVDDLKNFTLVAILGFSLVVFWVYRSGWILLGALVCAATAAFLDFLTLWSLKVEAGPLSANLWSIVFVLTLSHVVFITGNWERLAKSGLNADADIVSIAVRSTRTASAWSMITNSLGFVSLLFTSAKPIRQFGVAGWVGAVLAMGVAYAMFPAFLRLARRPPRTESALYKSIWRRLAGQHPWGVGVAVVMAMVAVAGYRFIDTQPPIYSYFGKGSKLRNDLERIDRLGGSIPLYLAVRGRSGTSLGNADDYIRLWELELALEEVPVVGEIVSLPVLLGEFVVSPLAPVLTWDLIYAVSENAGFVTEDRRTALYLLRMIEAEVGKRSREEIVEQVREVARKQGFEPVLTGGLFELTGELSSLVSKSLFQGVLGLVGMLFLIAYVVSRSFRMSVAVICSLLLVPLIVLGVAGYLRLPLEIISTPSINLAMGLGIDEMIHLVHESRRGGGVFDPEGAKKNLWKPILTSCGMLGLGFSIFWLSHFPPSQNLGWLVVIGSGVAAFSMLVVFPTLAQMFLRIGRRPTPEAVQPEPQVKKAA